MRITRGMFLAFVFFAATAEDCDPPPYSPPSPFNEGQNLRPTTDEDGHEFTVKMRPATGVRRWIQPGDSSAPETVPEVPAVPATEVPEIVP